MNKIFDYPTENTDEFLTQSECLRIIEHEITKLKHDNEETKLTEAIRITYYDGISMFFNI